MNSGLLCFFPHYSPGGFQGSGQNNNGGVVVHGRKAVFSLERHLPYEWLEVKGSASMVEDIHHTLRERCATSLIC